MRILLITSAPFPPSEGLGYHIWNLARHLVQQGHRVHIVTRGSRRSHTEQIEDGLILSRLSFAPVYPLHVHLHGVFVNRLVRLHEGDFDVINEHSPLPPVVGTRLPTVTSVHSPMRSDSAATRVRDLKTLLVRLQTPVSRHIETGLFRRSARITTVARWVAEALTKGYGVDAGRVTVTGNGVEDRFFSHAATLPRQPFVLYAGRVEVGKGLEELVMAARMVTDSRQALPLRFVIAGSGPLLPKIQGLVAEMGLADRFQFTGHIGADRREELVQLYRTAGIFTLPSYHEGMSTVMLEAMAAGAPVISTAVGGAPEVIHSGDDGWLVPPRDPAALAQAILTLWENPPLRAEMGARARATVELQYSWPAITEKYLAVYQEAILAQRMPVFVQTAAARPTDTAPERERLSS